MIPSHGWVFLPPGEGNEAHWISGSKGERAAWVKAGMLREEIVF